MAEFDNRYSSNGKGNAGVALGVVGTALGGLAAITHLLPVTKWDYSSSLPKKMRQ